MGQVWADGLPGSSRVLLDARNASCGVLAIASDAAELAELLDEINDAAKRAFGVCDECGGTKGWGACQDCECGLCEATCWACDGRGWTA
jgi:hypothetical protein